MNIEDDENDDEEKYVDAKLENQDENTESEVKMEENKQEDEKTMQPVLASWFHRESETKHFHNTSKYEPLKRNPLYAGGDFCAYDELLLLKNHFHPSVKLFAEQILNGKLFKF